MAEMTQIDSSSQQGIYTFMTESESKYELEILGKKITLKRIPIESKINKLRKDNQKLKVKGYFYVEIGKKAFFTLEPLGEGNVTFRITNTVTNITFNEHFKPNILH